MEVRILWAGAGPPLVFFPGWNTTAATVWSWLPEAFKARFRCGVIEWPGLGDAAGEVLPSALEPFLDGVEAALPEGPVSLAGFCLGGVAAWAFARRHPGRVVRTVVAESPQHFPAILAPLLLPGLGPLVLALVQGTGWGRRWVRRGILQGHVVYPEPFLAGLFAFPSGPSLAYLRVFRRYGAALRGPFEGLPPCWRLEGETALRVLRPAWGRRHVVPSTRVRLAGAGHFPAVEAPEAFFSTLDGILSGSPSPAPTGPAPGR